LFGRRDSESHLDRVETILGKGTDFKGTLTSSGLVRIDGRLEGEINHSGDLVVGESAVVVGTIKARSVTVAGQIQGNVECDGKLELTPSGKLYGDIKVGNLVIAGGAVFQGASLMPGQEPEAEPRTA